MLSVGVAPSFGKTGGLWSGMGETSLMATSTAKEPASKGPRWANQLTARRPRRGTTKALHTRRQETTFEKPLKRLFVFLLFFAPDFLATAELLELIVWFAGREVEMMIRDDEIEMMIRDDGIEMMIRDDDQR